MSGIFTVKFACLTEKGKEGGFSVKVKAHDEKGAVRQAMAALGTGKEESALAKYDNRITSITITREEAEPQKGVLKIEEEKPKRAPRKAKDDAADAAPETPPTE